MIKDFYSSQQVNIAINDDLVAGTVTQTIGDIPPEASLGAYFVFWVKDITSDVTIELYQSDTIGGTYTLIPDENLINYTNTNVLTVAGNAQSPGNLTLKIGLLGVTGPFYQIQATTANAAGTVHGCIISNSNVQIADFLAESSA